MAAHPSDPSLSNDLDSDEVAVISSIDAPPLVDVLASFNMCNVIITESEKNSLSINRKSKLTMLHSIGNILIGNIGVRSLKQFCTKVGIPGQRKQGKYEVCKAIVAAKMDKIFLELKDRPTGTKKEGAAEQSAVVWLSSHRRMDH